MQLDRVRVVLVETSHPGNIGACARAMKNMGLSRLHLVRPGEYPHPEATARAAGAGDILEQAVVCDTLEEALSGCGVVIGASARRRRTQWPEFDPHACAEFLVGLDQAEEAAVVFGREHSGLSNDELDRCAYLVCIPSNPAYSSLNLAAAVQVIAYEIYQCRDRTEELKEEQTGTERKATLQEMDGLYLHMERALTDIGVLDPQNPRLLMRRLRRLYNRAGLIESEVNILRGILSAIQARSGRKTT